MTNFFQRRPRAQTSVQTGELFIEDVSVAEIIERVGTPAYLYSASALREAFQTLDRAFGNTQHTLCYAIKANMNLAVVRTLVACGAGIDVTSGGELYRALKAGAEPRKIVYSGVGKTDAEIDFALETGIKMFNVESRAELAYIATRAEKLGKTASIAFRVNPDVDPETHPYIATGLRTSKFGIPIDEALDAYAEAKSLTHIRVIGVDCHIGSQLTKVQPFIDALARVRKLVCALREAGHTIDVIDVGGGLGVRYRDEEPPTMEEYAKAIVKSVGDLGCEIVCEPGRSLTANAGILVSRVLYQKQNQEKHFVIVDAGMNDFVRPSLYQAYQRIEPVAAPRSESRVVDVVGPICESGDFLAKDRELPRVERGELLAVFSAGAYGFAMSSNYNARTRAVEVLVRGRDFAVVREREDYEYFLRGESVPKDLTE